MTNKENGQGQAQTQPREVRTSVTSNNQLYIPGHLVKEVGFKSGENELTDGGKVVWYYHKRQDKAVLADDGVNRSSLEPVQVVKLSGISNDDLETGQVSGARITISKNLPETLYEKLTKPDRGKKSVVLRPIYARNLLINSTCISVYPALEFDRGELPNVDHSTGVDPDSSMEEAPIVDYGQHTNSI